MNATPSLIIAWLFYGFMAIFPYLYLQLEKKKNYKEDKR